MTKDKNTKLSDQNHISVDFGETMGAIGQNPHAPQTEVQLDPQQAMERELINRLSREKHRLIAELEIKFKEASTKRIKEQENKFKLIVAKEQHKYEELLNAEKQKFGKALQSKYSRVMKTTLQEREKSLNERLKGQHYAHELELRREIDSLKDELSQLQKTAAMQMSEAVLTAKKEQEQASRAVYENMVQASRDELLQQAEAKVQTEFYRREMALKQEHEKALKRHTAKLMRKYEAKLQEALFAQEQALVKHNQRHTHRQNEVFKQRVQEEVDSTVATMQNRLEMEFFREKQALNAMIESLRTENETNKYRMRVELENEFRDEYEYKFAQLKQKTEQNKALEIESQLATERQRITAKEREIENLLSQMQTMQEQARRADLQKSENIMHLQSEVTQERARITEKAEHEKRLLIEQHRAEIRALEDKLHSHGSIHKFTSSKSAHDPMLVSAGGSTRFSKDMEQDKQAALAAQEQKLRAHFAEQLRAARHAWAQEHHNAGSKSYEEDLAVQERRLRVEFQGILDQQRAQLVANFTKQRDIEIRSTVAKYKQKVLNEFQNARTNDLAAAEQTLKEQYAARMQQHGELARIEIERIKEQLQNEQAAKIQHAVDLHANVMQNEQDRKFAEYARSQEQKLKQQLDEEYKKLHLKFAQDKANLIKELTAKFTRDKHAAMHKYENDLREKLYKEMVKQKEFIQDKYTQTQEAALSDQKRRLEAQHKQELERLKQGVHQSNGQMMHDEIISGRNVEQLADRIFAKLQK